MANQETQDSLISITQSTPKYSVVHREAYNSLSNASSFVLNTECRLRHNDSIMIRRPHGNKMRHKALFKVDTEGNTNTNQSVIDVDFLNEKQDEETSSQGLLR